LLTDGLHVPRTIKKTALKGRLLYCLFDRVDVGEACRTTSVKNVNFLSAFLFEVEHSILASFYVMESAPNKHQEDKAMKLRIILAIIAALLPNLCAFADESASVNGSTLQSAGSGSGQPGSWSESMNNGNRPMRPKIK